MFTTSLEPTYGELVESTLSKNPDRRKPPRPPVRTQRMGRWIIHRV